MADDMAGQVQNALDQYLARQQEERASNFGEAVDKFNARRRANAEAWEASLRRPETAPGESSDEGE